MVRATALVIVGLLMMGGCQQASPPELTLREMPSRAEASAARCGGPTVATDISDIESRFVAVGEVIEAIQAGTCEPLIDQQRLCRSLFLIGATDPFVGVGLGLSATQIEQLVEWHHWALSDGAAAAEPDSDLVASLEAMRVFNVGLLAPNAEPSAIADAAITRATPSILEPLVVAEQACLSLPR